MDEDAVLIDIDEVLLDGNRRVRPGVIELLQRHALAGKRVLLWASAGRDHARTLARINGLAGLVAGYMDKPHSISSHVPCAVVEPYGCISSEDDSWHVLVESIMDRCSD